MVRATSAALSAHIPFLVHDDPLAVVADAWVRCYEGAAPAGELEVLLPRRWRHGAPARWTIEQLVPDRAGLSTP